MLFRRVRIAVVAALIAMTATAGVVVAQMESGDRGILPVDSSGTLEISGIHVDVGGKDADSARYAGWRIAQREGFRKLWAQVNKRPINQAPQLSDSVLDGMVSSIVVEQEQIGPGRYIADLGILFDRTQAGQLLGMGSEARRSPPMLLVPMTITGGTMTTVELKNPWQRAWAQFRTAQSAIDYVRVSGLGADPLLLNAAQASRPGRGWWRNLLDLYGAANVLTAEVKVARLYPGGPAKALFIARYGPDMEMLGSFEMTAKDSTEIPKMMAAGAAQMDRIFSEAFREGRVRADPNLVILPPPLPEEETEEAADVTAPVVVIQLLVASPDVSSLNAATASVRGISGVEGVTESSLAIGGTSRLAVSYRGDAAALRSALSAAGWNADYEGGMIRISRGGATPPPPQPSAGTTP